jgi:hypothetical protein
MLSFAVFSSKEEGAEEGGSAERPQCVVIEEKVKTSKVPT